MRGTEQAEEAKAEAVETGDTESSPEGGHTCQDTGSPADHPVAMVPSMSPVVVAIATVGVALLGTIIPFGTSIVGSQRAIHSEVAAVRSDIHALGERVARIEGAMPFLAASKTDQSSR